MQAGENQICLLHGRSLLRPGNVTGTLTGLPVENRILPGKEYFDIQVICISDAITGLHRFQQVNRILNQNRTTSNDIDLLGSAFSCINGQLIDIEYHIIDIVIK